jgi:uncharacterized protein YutE (UPF0331/DUF86 family)
MKAQAIERCIARVEALYQRDSPKPFQDEVRLEALILNLVRACESSIDLAARLVRMRRLGPPGTSKETFTLLESAGLLPPDVAERMRRMVGFRNIALHEYQRIDLVRLQSIVERGLEDIRRFVAAAIAAAS